MTKANILKLKIHKKMIYQVFLCVLIAKSQCLIVFVMMLKRIVKLIKKMYKVGKYYKVPCVVVPKLDHNGLEPYFAGRTMPIIDNLHNDIDILNVKMFHYHIDWRFVDKRIFNSFDDIFGVPDFQRVAKVIWVDIQNKPEIIYKNLRCKRDFEVVFPEKYQKLFNEKYKGAKLIKGHICPHKLQDLSNVNPNEKGEIVCPLHGLKFCKNSKQLIID